MLAGCSEGPPAQAGLAGDSVAERRAEQPGGAVDGPADSTTTLEVDDSAVAATAPWTNGNTRVVLEPPGVVVLKEVRTARNEGFDRIVFEFAGEHLPAYSIAYIDRPVRSCGSGDTVALPGDAWLEIRLEPAAAHTEEGEPTIADRRRSPGLPVLLGLTLTCDFEAVVTWVGGVAAPNRYRVLQLTAPARLVVDVEH